MKEWQVSVQNDSFDKAGITKDYQEAVCEYIWNGFEAGATKVEVRQTGAPMQQSPTIQIVDNGKGIEFERLEETFGAFLSSTKDSSSIRIKSQQNKGKGRFSYICLSHEAKWSTIYEQEGSLKKYEITTSSHNKNKFSTSDIADVTEGTNTGTTVEIPIAESKVFGQLLYTDMQQKLLQEFSWFLYLHQSQDFSIEYLGTTLDYKQYINTELSVDCTKEIEEKSFRIDLIVWRKNIDNSSKIYFLSKDGKVCHAMNTGFNKNTVDFFHNVFVTSDYITPQNVIHLNNDNPAQLTMGESKDEQKRIFGQLKKEIQTLISDVLKKFLIQRADKELADMEERGSLPDFPDDEYSQLRKKDFQTVTRELYCVEPKIFHRLKIEQEKSLLGFMNLLLASSERENLLTIVEHVVNLTSEQRNTFADILQRTKLQYIVDAIAIVDKRCAIVEELKKIVFDLAKFANERDHIQKIVEQHFWLFGEQYHLLTADKTLATSLAEFEALTSTETEVKKSKSANSEKGLNQRADIFLYTQRTQEDSSNERLVVELKAPSVSLSLDVYNQVERYAYTIRKEPRFNGTNRFWRFYAVCSTVEDDVKTKYANFKQYGKNGLVNVIDDRFEIYALSWDDIFQSFEARHSILFDKLELDYTQALDILDVDRDAAPSRGVVDEMSNKITELNPN